MKIIRFILGRLILLFDFLFPPRRIKRESQQQAAVEIEASALTLYQFKACPFCVKVRRNGKRLNLPLETRNVLENQQWHDELEQQGGKRKVPCLRIEDSEGQYQWLYNSKDIINYLNQRFNPS